MCVGVQAHTQLRYQRKFTQFFICDNGSFEYFWLLPLVGTNSGLQLLFLMSPSLIQKKPHNGAFGFSIGCLGVSSFVGSVQYEVEDDRNIVFFYACCNEIGYIVLEILCKTL